MRRIIALAMVSAMSLTSTPLFAVPATQAQSKGSIFGTVQSSTGQTIANTVVGLRNLQTGQLASTTTSNGAGQFSFVGLNPGTYIVEVINAAGKVAATSAPISVPAGAVVTDVTVTTTPAEGAVSVGVGAFPICSG